MLEVRDLTVRFPTSDGIVQAVSNVSFTLRRGETLGIVGESGSGKSVSNLAIMGLLNPARTSIAGEVRFEGRELLTLPPDQMRAIRGKDIAMIFQDPFASLHPMYRVGQQISEAVLAHADVGKEKAWERAVELLDQVGIPNAASRARDYRTSSRVACASADDRAGVAQPGRADRRRADDRASTTVQAQILELIDQVKKEFDIGVILVTHDLARRRRDRELGARDVRGRSRSRAHRPTRTGSRRTRARGGCSTRCRRSRSASTRSCRSKAPRRRCSPRRPAARSTPAARTRSRHARRTCRP
jgi:ABC-type microcin C transport system duplicated ATPase subunit YejF